MKKFILRLVTIFLLSGCQEFLEEEVFTEYDPEAFLQDESGIDALLTGVYGSFNVPLNHRDYMLVLNEFTTDMTWETGGGLNRLVVPIIGFTWDPSIGFFNGRYNEFYSVIAAANNVLSVTNTVEGVNDDALNKARGEARFMRGFSYYLLHILFGPTPIIEIPPGASLDDIESIGKETPRATEEEYRAYVEADLMFAAENLEYGGLSSRANKGSAYAILTKFHLNNKEWEKAAAAAEKVLFPEAGYTLYPDYTTLFAVSGENNNEFIFRWECMVGSDQINGYMPHAFPPFYPVQSNWENFGAQFRTYTKFYESFEDADTRKLLFLDEYVPTNTGVLTPLNRDSDGNPLDNVRSFKYVPDPNAQGRFFGNDIPYIRLADILLARAEALNEMNGPNQEGVDLINQVRDRASVDPVSLSDFPTKEALRNFILAERGRELYTEGFRREDLIRQGKYIQQALDRGKPAQPHHVLYPIPQPQIDNNPNLEQNPGY